jgi:tetratricopeptide (TPR) repeat protein
MALSSDPADKFECILGLADALAELRKYDRAVEILNEARGPDGRPDGLALEKLAEINGRRGKFAAAAKCVETAIIWDKENVKLWTLLAKYHRLGKNISKADGAATKALSLSKSDAAAKLEKARVSKAAGKTREYRDILTDILNDMKERYRDSGL